MKFICKYLPLCINLVSFASNHTIDPRVEQSYVRYQIKNAYMYDLVMSAPVNESEMAQRNDVIRTLSQQCLKRQLLQQEQYNNTYSNVINNVHSPDDVFFTENLSRQLLQQARCKPAIMQAKIDSIKDYAQALKDTLNDPSCILYTSIYDVDYEYLQSKTHHDAYDRFKALSENDQKQLYRILSPIYAAMYNNWGLSKSNDVSYQQIYNIIEQVHKQLQKANFTYIEKEFDYILAALKEHIDKKNNVDYIDTRLQFFIGLCNPEALNYNIHPEKAECMRSVMYKIIAGINEDDDNAQLLDHLTHFICMVGDTLADIFISDVVRNK